jgi:hypothetical protein
MVAPKMAEEPRTRIEHPNRGKASSQVTRLIVVLLLLVSVVLMLIVTIGGWATLAGAKPVQLAYILVYLVLAFFVARWNRGVLPLIAALAIGLGIFAAISVPGWFARDHPGFTDPGLASDLLGLICALIAIVQLLLIFFAMSGFRQAWNVEVEKPRPGDRDEDADRGGGSRRRRDEAEEGRWADRDRDAGPRDRAPDEQPTTEQPRREPGTGSSGPSPAPA